MKYKIISTKDQDKHEEKINDFLEKLTGPVLVENQQTILMVGRRPETKYTTFIIYNGGK